MGFLQQKRIMSLDIDESFVVARELTKRGARISLGRHSTLSSLSELIKDPSLKFKDEGVVINAPTQIVYFRSFAINPGLSKLLKLKNRKSREKEISTFIARQNLPIKLEECYWTIFILNDNLNLVAARKEIIERHIAIVENLGLRVVGVIPSIVSLYNVFIYNYPKNKNRFALLNIKSSASDMIIYEARHLWICPISVGSHTLRQDESAGEKFSLEIQRTLNSYYIQNNAREKSILPFYLSGQDLFSSLAFSLKKALGEVELIEFEPFKNVVFPKDSKVNRQVSTLSLGLGITYFRMPQTINVNLLREKMLKAQHLNQVKLFKKISIPLMIISVLILGLVNINLIKDVKDQISLYKQSNLYVSKILPELKLLKSQKDKYQKPLDFLRGRLNRQILFLKALAAISEGRPKTAEIREFSAEVKDAKLQVLLSGTGPSYAEINEFLNNIRKNEEIKETKIIASSAAGGESSGGQINFKLRFEMPVPEPVSVKAQAENTTAVKNVQGTAKK
ncbi:MAG: PilN domain-containing protein [Candidatus Omnitrophica bacterium]|nr:PilN domain-containing protein [Candidatus Omnitrophota bacterium]